MARIRPIKLKGDSPYIDEPCALCQAPFAVGDKVVVCPEDHVRHHVACWEVNGNHCVALGCEGSGRVSVLTQAEENVVEQADLVIGEEDPLLDPANIPDRPLPKRSGWKGLSKVFRGCLIAGLIAMILLCISLTVLVYLLVEAVNSGFDPEPFAQALVTMWL
ncbi:MAG: hypothetical protein KDE51_25540 [Anaerolineales bacterium]|nr:hypothetical protein [Anaerolineales bacterium]